MNDWITKLFVKHSNIFLKLLDEMWSRTEALVNGMVKILADFGITSVNYWIYVVETGGSVCLWLRKGLKPLE